MCNLYDDCYDFSEEEDCSIFSVYSFLYVAQAPSPILINFDGNFDYHMYYNVEYHIKGYQVQRLHGNESYTCPESHFTCEEEFFVCLPMYLRCNGVKDCVGGQDELACEDSTCSGYYRYGMVSQGAHSNFDHV